MYGFGDFEIPTIPDPTWELLEAIREKNYPKAYTRLKKLKEPLQDQRAGECLSAALQCSPELFRAVLEHCAPGEYAATEQWKLNWIFDRYVHVEGTILTLAAAMNKVKHMRILLDHGWDVNSASPASAQAQNIELSSQFFGFFWTYDGFGGMSQSGLVLGVGEHNTYQKAIAEPQWSIDCCTPLAAAIACGSVSAVRLLLRQPGVRREDSSAVCAAALMAVCGAETQQECVRMVFGLRNLALNPSALKRELLSERALDLATIAQFCRLREFTQRLRGIPCTVEQARAAAAALRSLRKCKKREQKLLRLLSFYPELGKEQAIQDNLLGMYFLGSGGQRVREELLRCWKKLCGEVRDISNLPPLFLDDDIFRQKLAALSEGGVLCCAAGSDWLRYCISKGYLTALSEHVHFYRSSHIGISLLAMQILKHKDAKFIKLMAQRGMLDGEPREDLFAYVARENNNLALRAMLLAAPVNCGGEVREATPNCSVFWSAEMARMGQEKREAWAREAWTCPLDAAACLERINLISSMDCYERDLFHIGYSFWEEQMDDMVFDTLAAAACCGKNPELLRVLLGRRDCCERRSWVSLSWGLKGDCFGARESLNGSLLCAAAAAGRTEQVQILLDQGFDPNEADMVWRSTYSTREAGSRVVTPLYMALEKGHYETARLLRAHGAVVWPAREEEETRCAAML